MDLADLEARIASRIGVVTAAREQIGRVIVGQQAMVDRLLIGLLASGHVLVEGVPGLAKTTAIRCLASTLDLSFSRIQFTPDLLPADLVGTQIYQPATGTFATHRGPVFANLVLADEINRAPAKVQSALLEAMQERQVTIDQTYALPRPFLVLATQNPIEQEGTYPLPEAQVDRFMMKLRIDYPSAEEELEVVARAATPAPELERIATADDIVALQDLVRRVHVSEELMQYIVGLVRTTRSPGEADPQLVDAVDYGASPRASIALTACARAHAFLDGRAFAMPEDVKALAPDVLRHRVVLSYDGEADGLRPEDVIRRILAWVDMP